METQARIRAFVVENFYVSEDVSFDDDTSLIETGIVDSTGVLEIVAFLEKEFAVAIPDRDIVPANLDSIGRMAAYLARQAPERTRSTPQMAAVAPGRPGA